MSNEEFQKLVLKKFDNIETRLDKLDKRFDTLENKLDEMEAKNSNNHILLMKSIDELKESNKSIHEIIGKNEVDITTLKRKIV
jgi:hypothetical protein